MSIYEDILSLISFWTDRFRQNKFFHLFSPQRNFAFADPVCAVRQQDWRDRGAEGEILTTDFMTFKDFILGWAIFTSNSFKSIYRSFHIFNCRQLFRTSGLHQYYSALNNRIFCLAQLFRFHQYYSALNKRIFCLVLCTDVDQKSETIVWSLKCENYDKFTWNY